MIVWCPDIVGCDDSLILWQCRFRWQCDVLTLYILMTVWCPDIGGFVESVMSWHCRYRLQFDVLTLWVLMRVWCPDIIDFDECDIMILYVLRIAWRHMTLSEWLIDYLLLYVPLKKFALNMETLPLPVKSCKVYYYTRRAGPLSREGYYRATPSLTRDLGFSGFSRL